MNIIIYSFICLMLAKQIFLGYFHLDLSSVMVTKLVVSYS